MLSMAFVVRKVVNGLLKSGKMFGCSVTERIKKFYRALNAIMRVHGRSDDMVMLRLLESHCIPILTYAIEIVHIANQGERRKLRVAYNSVFRKLFGFRYFESVTVLQHSLGRLTWEEICDEKKDNFLKRATFCQVDSLVRALCSTTAA